jgi:hypothetical protein
MDAKTLEHMTVIKLREEAMKFSDLVGVHGMNKAQLVVILKQKLGLTEHKTESDVLAERKHALKKKIGQLKAAKQEKADPKQAAVLRRRLRRQRRVLKKVVAQAKPAAKA